MSTFYLEIVIFDQQLLKVIIENKSVCMQGGIIQSALY